MREKSGIPRTDEEKSAQIRKEAKWTIGLFAFCAVWSVATGMGLSGCGIYFLHLPLWWWLSTPGLFVLAVAGLLFLLKFVFKDFDLGEEEEGAE